MPSLVAGLVVKDKWERVRSFHEETVKSTAEILGAMSLNKTSDLRPWHRMRRTDFTEIRHYGEIYDFLEDGELLSDPIPISYERAMKSCSHKSFAYSG